MTSPSFVRGVSMFRNNRAMQKWNELMDAIDEAPIVVPCQNTDPELWFGDAVNENSWEDHGARYKIARELCGICPVRQQCLQYALTQREEYGMWGGLTPKERLQILRGNR
jgi:WhiB family redox-sensing transcriptional regulator